MIVTSVRPAPASQAPIVIIMIGMSVMLVVFTGGSAIIRNIIMVSASMHSSVDIRCIRFVEAQINPIITAVIMVKWTCIMERFRVTKFASSKLAVFIKLISYLDQSRAPWLHS